MVTSVVAFVVSVTTQERHVLGILQVTHGLDTRPCASVAVGHGHDTRPCILAVLATAQNFSKVEILLFLCFLHI